MVFTQNIGFSQLLFGITRWNISQNITILKNYPHSAITWQCCGVVIFASHFYDRNPAKLVSYRVKNYFLS